MRQPPNPPPGSVRLAAGQRRALRLRVRHHLERTAGWRCHRGGRCPRAAARTAGKAVPSGHLSTHVSGSLNLSDWALRPRALVWFFMVLIITAGLFSYKRLGRNEDPAFTVKTMVVQAAWPGATVDEMIKQVTDCIE